MRRKVHYVIEPTHVWNSIAELARVQDAELLRTLQQGFTYIETNRLKARFTGNVCSEINLIPISWGEITKSETKALAPSFRKIAEGINKFSTDTDILGDAYEYLIGQFAAGSGKKQANFTRLSRFRLFFLKLVRSTAKTQAEVKETVDNVLDFACGSGSLLLNVPQTNGHEQHQQNFGQERTSLPTTWRGWICCRMGKRIQVLPFITATTLVNDWRFWTRWIPRRSLGWCGCSKTRPFSYR